MPQGRLVLNKVLYDGCTPEVQCCIMQFIQSAEGEVVCSETSREYVYAFNHPDFMEGDPPVNYTLGFERVYDANTNSEWPKLHKLYYWSDDYKVGVAKQYA